MQTFLPLPSYAKSAACLDSQRLGKQRVEAKQILIALGISVGKNPGNRGSSWRNHPAVRMWRGYEPALAVYGIAVCTEWRKRGFHDTLLPQFQDARQEILCESGFVDMDPDWLGMDELHASHRSNLLRKFPQFYGRYGWSEPDDLPYLWPVPIEATCV